jgi:glycosyltransferase involved in cell wall biosynthesis
MTRTSPVIWYIFPAIGGPGLGRYWRAYHLAQAWQNAGARPIVIGPGYHHYFQRNTPLSGTHRIGGVTYHFIPTKPYGRQTLDRLRAILSFGVGLMIDRELAKLARTHRPDVIVYSSPYPFGYLAAHRLARRYKAALVFEVRDLWPLSLTELLGLASWHPFVLAAGACERIAYATADRVVSLLPHADAHMIKRGLDAGRFAYIPNGVALQGGQNTSCTVDTPLLKRARSLAAEGRFLIVHAGNMSMTTNLAPLIEAAKLLQDRGITKIVMLMVGRGEAEATLKEQARALQLSNVEFFSQVDKTDVTELLRLAHAGFAALTPSPIYRFGSSLNKVLDYMLAGLPIVFACDCSPNMVEQAGAGVTVSPVDPAGLAAALTRLAGLPVSERAAMGARGRAFVEKEHEYGLLGRKYMNLFADIRPLVFARH